jgi:5'-3' exonuclease
MHALIDGDVIVYNAGFASDAAAKREGKEHEPLAYCLHGVSEKIRSIENAVGATKTTIFLSHPVNRREQLFPDYKANRDPNHKPYWYDEIKEFLLDHKGAIYSQEGDEADDALGIAAMMDEDAVVCSVDKDLDMIPGLHYNWSKNNVDKGVYETQDPEALQAFYTQLITGDSTDNIPGLFKHSKIKATAQIKMPLEGMTRAREMYDYVMKIYRGDTNFVHLIAQLLWIKRDNRLWMPPA